MKIIGFVGPKQAGKDTASNLLKKAKKVHGKLSFAKPLKRVCEEVFGISFNSLNDPILKEKTLKKPIVLTSRLFRQVKRVLPVWVSEINPDTGLLRYNLNSVSITGLEGRVVHTPRELLQVIGTDFIRDRVYRDWHIRAAFSPKNLIRITKSGIYCITDIRFENEYQAVKDQFGDAFTCYYIERPEAEKVLKTAVHDSELSIIEVKKNIPETNILKNHGTIKDFKIELKKIEFPTGDYKI